MPHVLLVDDDASIREVLVTVLGNEGYQVEVAATQEDALRLVEAEMFDLVVADPFAHGGAETLQSVSALRDRAAPTPVGIMTGWPVDDEEAHAAGFASFVTKPFDIDRLLTEIAAAVQTPGATGRV